MNSTAHRSDERLLVVNADDYGRFRCTSRGILEAFEQGVVTATGVMANVDELDAQASWLLDHPGLDVGIHLNLTWGCPLDERLGRRLSRFNHRFPGRIQLLRALVDGSLTVSGVEAEWRLQIERLQQLGLRLTFVNSHEHVHMLPSLHRVARDLARHYEVPFLRFVRPHWREIDGPGAALRAALLAGMAGLSRRSRAHPTSIGVIGTGASGRLQVQAVERLLRRLRPGTVHELMCHPGRMDPGEVDDARLHLFHRWEEELALLTSDRLRALLAELHIRVVGFRDLLPLQGRRDEVAVI